MKNRAAWIIICILLTVAFVQTWKGYVARRERDSLAGRLIEADSLRQETATIYSMATHENVRLAEKNKELSDLAEKQGGELRQYVRIVGEYERILIEGEAIEEAFIDSTGKNKVRVVFHGEDKGVRVIGWTEAPPPFFRLSVFRPPVILDVLVVQEKNGLWKTYVDTNDPYLKLTDVKTETRPFKKPWYRQFYLYGETGFVPNVGMVAGIGGGYKSWGLSMIFIQEHYGLVIQRRFEL